MDKNTTPQKRRWRLNLFDIIVICILIAAGIVFLMVSRASRGTGLTVSSGTSTTVRYMIELSNMTESTTKLIQEGDIIYDRVEKRTLGKVASFVIEPFKQSTRNYNTGDTEMLEKPGRYTAFLILETAAQETDSSIIVDGGFLVRSGLPVSANGPRYAGIGYIISVERDGE